MEDDEFNFHRIVKTEKNVAQQALKELFEILWNRKYPETPWANTAESVKLFEQKEDEHFQNSLQGLSNKEKGRKIDKRSRLRTTFRDNEWKCFEWDISKFAYALIDSKLFELDESDDAGMPISEHIVKIKDIRNTTAHFTTSACDTKYFEKTLKSLEDHIKAFELVKVNVDTYLEELRKIKSEEKPVTSKEWWEMRTQFEKLKISQQIYEEREKRYNMLEKLNAEREKHSKEIERLQVEYKLQAEEVQRLQSENAKQKQTHSEELERLQTKNKEKLIRVRSENELQKQAHSEEIGRLQSENKEKLERVQSENELQKQAHSEEIGRLQSENELQKKRHSKELHRLQSENELHMQRYSKEHDRLWSENEQLR